MLYTRTRDMNVTMQDYRTDCCIRGYHIYRDIWVAVIGEVLECEREPTNTKDRNAVAITKKWDYNWTLTKELFKSLFAFFFRRGGSIRCEVTGGRRYSADLPQGGLEIPCRLLFKGKAKSVKKLKQCLFRITKR